MSDQRVADHRTAHLSVEYLRTGNLVTLSTDISSARGCLSRSQHGSNSQSVALWTLALCLRERYMRSGEYADLEEATKTARAAVDVTSENLQEQIDRLYLLEDCISDQYSETRDLVRRHESIQIIEEIVKLSRAGNLDLIMPLNYLASGLRARYRQTGQMDDLNRAIVYVREAAEIALGQDNNPLSTLATLLHERFFAIGRKSDLDEAIEVLERLRSEESNEQERASILNNLSCNLLERFLRKAGRPDMDQSIECAREACELISSCDELRRLHGSTGNTTTTAVELDAAIDAVRSAIVNDPSYGLDRPIFLQNLGNGLEKRYEAFRDLSDLQESINVAQEALAVTTPRHESLPHIYDALSERHFLKFLATQAPSDLEYSVNFARAAVDYPYFSGDDLPDQGIFRFSLGQKLSYLYLTSPQKESKMLREAIEYCKSTLNQHNTYIETRIRAGNAGTYLSVLAEDWTAAYAMASLTASLLSKMAARSLQTSDKQYLLNSVAGAASDAAALALKVLDPAQAPTAALYLLEQGRGILATSLEEMRSEIASLEDCHPELAKRLIGLRQEIHSFASRPTDLCLEALNSSGSPPDDHFARSEELDRLISEIRTHSGFEDFLGVPQEHEMRYAARFGPLVVINISDYRCDALLIEVDQIRAIALPNLQNEEIRIKVDSAAFDSPATLQWLWRAVTSPILEALGFLQCRSDDDIPHIWWIPTGSLCRFPLHAAGSQDEGMQETVLDRVMSSYGSSVKTIVHSRRNPATDINSGKALLIAMEKTLGSNSLPFASKEVALVRQLCETMNFSPFEAHKHKQDVLEKLRECTMFHFAGHGFTDVTDPLQSGLLLEDWKTNPFTLADLLEMNLRERSPFLAYLSACSTGRIEEESFADETLHLISGFQLAGFRHVIGTLWEVNDERCASIAALFYEGLKDGQGTDSAVCRALHRAAKTLRDSGQSSPAERIPRSRSSRNPDPSWPRQLAPAHVSIAHRTHHPLSRDIESDDEDDWDFDSHSGSAIWIPYVHFGV